MNKTQALTATALILLTGVAVAETLDVALASLWKDILAEATFNGEISPPTNEFVYVYPDNGGIAYTDNLFTAARYTAAADDNAIKIVVASLNEAGGDCDFAVQVGTETRDLNQAGETVFDDVQTGDKVAWKLKRTTRDQTNCALNAKPQNG